MIARHGKFEYALAERYRIEDELGRGAMGTVYRAKDLRLERPVAIKMLHPALTNELGVSRFQSEIRIAASLHHPNIVAVHESGEADGRLFYVMDYLGGESLRVRLRREKQLSVEDALRIVDDIADGLQYAHDHGVVHRDVKPENIMLADGRVCIVDFGLARALGDVDTERLTASGLSVGTPHYLSPEQASAEKEVGPRADQYALACVLYEMLIGEPPFTGPTASSIAMRHISEAPPHMKTRRKTTPSGVESAVSRAMEKVPADRFGTVREFARACRLVEGSSPVEPKEALKPRRSYARIAGAFVAGVLLLLAIVVSRSNSTAANALDEGVRWLTRRPLNSARYVVLPFAFSGSPTFTIDIQSELRDALAAWRGMSVAGDVELRAAMSDRGSTPLTAAEGGAIARALGAGHFIMGVAKAEGEGVRIRVELLDTRKGTLERSSIAFVPRDSGKVDSVLSHVAFALMFGAEASRNEPAARGSRDRTAFARYLNGRSAMREWNLPRADSAFSASLNADPSFPQASLALAEVKGWSRDNAVEIGGLIARALNGASRLSESERLRAMALGDLSSGRYPASCARFDSLIRRDSLDFGAWYGTAECNRRDDAVIVDRRSPSGHRYRGSHNYAAIAIDRAFDLLPHIDVCCLSRAAAVIRKQLPYVSNSAIRFGRGVSPDTTIYLAFPEEISDSLALIPFPARSFTRPPPPTRTLALDRQRRLLRTIAEKRVALAPKSADALELLGEAMELRGDMTAVDTIRRARAVAARPGHALRLAVTETWLRLKRALPDDVRQLSIVRAFADSIVANSPNNPESDVAAGIASLAALIGNAERAAKLSESMEADGGQPDIPPEVLSNAWSFLTYAAMGGPLDSLRDLDSRLTTGILNGVLRHQGMVSTMYLGRGAGLAFPVYRVATFSKIQSTSPVTRAEAAYARGNKLAVRTILGEAQRARSGARPADLTLDALYPEAWLLAAVGDTSAALRLLDLTLNALHSVPASQLAHPVIAGTLVQAMALHAVLLSHVGKRALSRRWARAVVALTDSAHASALPSRAVVRLLAH